jgi:WD40 repeat protein
MAEPVRALAWSGDGRLLAVAGAGGVTLLDGSNGRIRDRIPALPGFSVSAISFAPKGRRLAIALNAPGRARAISVDAGRRSAQPRLLFAGAGRFTQLSWSPDGRWIAVAWPEADQWLFLRSATKPGVSAVRGIARQFDPSSPAPSFPSLGGWCCG